MRLIRVYLDAPLSAGAKVELRGPAREHATRVLRLRTGDALTLFNGDGQDYRSTITELRRGTVCCEVQSVEAARGGESSLPVTLVQGVARAERMDLVVQKATELGVAAVQPVLTERSVVKLDASAREHRRAHWAGVAVAACEQSGRARLPEIAPPLLLADWLARPAEAGRRRLQLDLLAGESLAARAAGAAAVEILIGPEGGLTENERDAARQTGYLSCRLGPRVLRSETAAIAALAVLQATAGDLR